MADEWKPDPIETRRANVAWARQAMAHMRGRQASDQSRRLPPAPDPDELAEMRARNPLFDGVAFLDASRLGEISLDTAGDGADGITPPEDGQRQPDDVSANL